MRPSILNPLFAQTTSLKGIGPRMGQLLARVAGPRVLDLLFLLPANLVDRSKHSTIANAPDGGIVTLTLKIERHRQGRGRAPYRITASDRTGLIDLVFFHAEGDWLEKSFPVGATRIVSGQLNFYGGRAQMTHPDYVLAPEDAGKLPLYEPVYPLTEGLTGRMLAKAVGHALAMVPDLPEWQDADWLKALAAPALARSPRLRLAAASERALSNHASAALRWSSRLGFRKKPASKTMTMSVNGMVMRMAGPPIF